MGKWVAALSITKGPSRCRATVGRSEGAGVGLGDVADEGGGAGCAGHTSKGLRVSPARSESFTLMGWPLEE